MIVTNNKSNQAKKCCTDSLSEEEIEKEISTTVDYSNAYVLKNIQLNLVTNGLAHVAEERPEGIFIRRLEI